MELDERDTHKALKPMITMNETSSVEKLDDHTTMDHVNSITTTSTACKTMNIIKFKKPKNYNFVTSASTTTSVPTKPKRRTETNGKKAKKSVKNGQQRWLEERNKFHMGSVNVTCDEDVLEAAKILMLMASGRRSMAESSVHVEEPKGNVDVGSTVGQEIDLNVALDMEEDNP